MRDYRFRVWDPATETMTYNVGLHRISEYADETLVKMQMTGLKDKRGNNVYDGDFLKCYIPVEIIDNGCNALDGETVIARVLFENGCFMAEAKTINYPWVLNGDNTILSWLLDIKAYDRYTVTSEVCGNIYETPELLKQE